MLKSDLTSPYVFQARLAVPEAAAMWSTRTQIAGSVASGEREGNSPEIAFAARERSELTMSPMPDQQYRLCTEIA